MDSIADPTPPLQSIVPSYVYQQYIDDPNIVAFATAFNTLAQTYLAWFNQTSLGLYTSSYITGQLLDWIGQGVYGIPRPVFSTLSTQFIANAINAVPINALAINATTFSESGTATVANDDFYKRTITWLTYVGDGRICNISNIRKRVARFLYGTNGGDITYDQSLNVTITDISGIAMTITLPAGTASNYFEEAFNSGILTFPFMLDATIVVSS